MELKKVTLFSLIFVFTIQFNCLHSEAFLGFGKKDKDKDDTQELSCRSSKNEICSLDDNGKEKSDAKNLHLIDEDTKSGFAIYRMGAPNEKGVKELCKLGIREVVVMSGNAQDHEQKYQSACPELKVVYNEIQSAKIPMDKKFINFFDDWVTNAKKQGIKIAFRCDCGCHRTGRLAAYYQLKYQGITSTDANILMKKHGKYMFLYPHLDDQVIALKDYLSGRPCSVSDKYCVKE